jgi:DNA-binding transcriptional regulator/RsmH inhibitor MraZ
MLPEGLCAHAKLSETAAFAGRGRYFEIWEPRALDAYKAEARQRAADKQRTLRQQGSEGTNR